MENSENYKILIVDDEKEYQNVVSLILREAGYSTQACSNGREAFEHVLSNDIDLIITDLRMPVMSGDELILKVREAGIDVDIMVVTAYGSIENAVNAIQKGADDYFVKSSSPDELLIKVKRMSEIHHIKRKGDILLKKQNVTDAFLESKNPKYRRIIDMCNRTADSDINILLLGESGVGKEVVAKYIHRISNRATEPFIPVNCQEFPEGVIESELFGHEKGAFTGAVGSRTGKFEEANFGTIFLDEIGDLPLTTQGKLLRFLETRIIERIGSNKRTELDVRFIFATNKDLPTEIEDGRFRDDLLYRINTLTLTIPPLRERREDLQGLIEFFIRKVAIDQKKKNISVDDSVMMQLLEYDYPGNVRELKNIVERMIALSRDGRITVNESMMPLGNPVRGEICGETGSLALKEARESFEKRYIESCLALNRGNVAKTAEKLEISARQLWNKISQYNIQVRK